MYRSKSEKKKQHFLDVITNNFISKDNNRLLYKKIKEDDNMIHNSLLYNDCHDLSQKEKEFFVLWNNFMDVYHLIEKDAGITDLEILINMFLNQNSHIIKEKQFVDELFLFLNYLLDNGDISINCFYYWTIKINENN